MVWDKIKTGASNVGAGTIAAGLTSSRNEASPVPWFFAAIVLYFSDVFLTNFNGIDIGLFISRFNEFGLSNFMRLFFNAIVIISLIVYYMLKKPNSKEFFSFFILLEIFMLIFSLGGFNMGGIFHLVFAGCLYFFYLAKVSDNIITANFTMAVLIFIDFFGFGILAETIGNPLVANRLIIPIWIYYILISAKEKPRWMSWIVFFIIIINVFAFANGLVDLGKLQTGLEDTQVEEAKGFFSRSWGNLIVVIGSFFDSLRCAGDVNYNECLKKSDVERRCSLEFNKGTSDYQECYDSGTGAGVKGETKGELTATEVKFSKPKEIYKDNIAKEGKIYPIPYDLTVSSLENSITIITSCKFIKDDEEKVGIITPDYLAEFEHYGSESVRRISCIPSEPFKKGDYKIRFEATAMGVKTTAYLDRIFIDKDVSKETKSKILADRSLKSVQGAVTGDEFAAFYFEIGTQETFIVSEDIPTQTIIGNLKNLKKGKVINVDSVVIDLRDPSITPNYDCSSSGFYSVQNGIAWKGPGIPDINCQLNIPASLRELGPRYGKPEFIHKEFKADIIYNYQIKKEDSFKVISSSSVA